MLICSVQLIRRKPINSLTVCFILRIRKCENYNSRDVSSSYSKIHVKLHKFFFFYRGYAKLDT